MVGTTNRGEPFASLPRAQRLSASLWSAQLGAVNESSGKGVLNAFRHHCGRHSVRVVLATKRILCSTPFGITVVGTTFRCAASSASCRVLNAFRHHCGRHGCCVVDLLESRKCSTPFGITVVGTPVTPTCFPELPCAQRLSASLWSARSYRSVSHTVRSRAQRLSASLWSALHGLDGNWSDEQVSVCSTPFGITVVGTGRAGGGLVDNLWCSTPFGITVVGTCSLAFGAAGG